VSDLGKLERVKPLTDVWPSEPRDFTPWLSQEPNLALIGEALGFGTDWLELVETEANVGAFRADIVCRDTGYDDQFVLIENQYGSSDHDHLGKLLTYAAGRKAKTVIWIAEMIRDEHRAAIDLLNEATDDSYQFFALEIELWRIGDSPVAPRFNIVAKPNEWSRTVSKSARNSSNSNLTKLEQTHIDYWTAFKIRLTDTSQLRCNKPRPRQWMDIRIGRTGFRLRSYVNTQHSWIQASLEFFGDNGTNYFHLMQMQQEEIKQISKYPLTWEELPTKKTARVGFKTAEVVPTNSDDWTDQHIWLIERLNHLHDLFHDRVKRLDLDQYETGDSESAEE